LSYSATITSCPVVYENPEPILNVTVSPIVPSGILVFKQTAYESPKPEEPDVPEVPLFPDVPEEPDVPASPEEPDVPEVPLFPEVPEEPEEPAVPDVPDVPCSPIILTHNGLMLTPYADTIFVICAAKYPLDS